MKLSVVIPVLNERALLPATIAALRACRGVQEIIVADGGSTDGTVPWLQAQPDIVLVRSIRGKGPQINIGAAAASDVPGASDISETSDTETSASETVANEAAASNHSSHVLLFLHADCLISQPAIDALHAALVDPQL
ncbi:MAG TPA: glycosyltransferase, partial [Alphaproteobacteria bacterium]|nr:glycosyltransferase [Alphaproteobacteria bacterium]